MLMHVFCNLNYLVGAQVAFMFGIPRPVIRGAYPDARVSHAVWLKNKGHGSVINRKKHQTN